MSTDKVLTVDPATLPRLMDNIGDWVYGLFPDRPRGFDRVPHSITGPWTYYEQASRHIAIRVICTAHVYGDGKRWMHVSFSRPDRIPTWADLRKVKDTFIGLERLAVQVFPRQSEYVNLHKYVLHLWSCLDGDPTPDFRVDGGRQI